LQEKIDCPAGRMDIGSQADVFNIYALAFSMSLLAGI
jgi:hypothetical protein